MDTTKAKLLEEALPYLESHENEGPQGEGWQSDELKDLIKRIYQILGRENGSKI